MRPIIRIIKNKVAVISASFLIFDKIMGIGIRRTSSMSNTIKMIPKRKNRVENGIRAV
jgi:hypothetical protein